ncbi:MAG: hypothetical protein AB1500_11155 [Bacillota bacterium]
MIQAKKLVKVQNFACQDIGFVTVRHACILILANEATPCLSFWELNSDELPLNYNKLQSVFNELHCIRLETFTKRAASARVKKHFAKLGPSLCWDCGLLIPTQNPFIRQRCPSCQTQYEKRRSLLRKTSILEMALLTLERQDYPVCLHDYKEASEVLKDRIESEPESLTNVHEIVALMELLRNRIKVKLHPVIVGSPAGLVLPGENVVLKIVRNHKQRDAEREIELRAELGPQWEILSILMAYIEDCVQKLLPLIRSIHNQRQSIRRKNSGILPEWYSKQDEALLQDVKRKLGMPLYKTITLRKE